MKYIGPDYDNASGIILPGLNLALFPRLMTDAQIHNLLSQFIELSPYFDMNGLNPITLQTGTNTPVMAIYDLTEAQILALGDNNLAVFKRVYIPIDSAQWYIGQSDNTVKSFAGYDKSYTHIQSTPSVTWTITHNLEKYPSISVTDSARNKIHGREKYISLNVVEILFSAPFSGECFCN